MAKEILAPGARIIVRDEEWLVRRIDRTSNGTNAIHVTGLSSLVAGQDRIFLDSLDTNIKVVDPKNTSFVVDDTPNYRKSRLYLESLLRQTPPTDENLYIGHKAAMDVIPYQLDPAVMALKEPRQRILIADSVGLGKTLECGILLSELIKRGKGKRILVLAVKSMLTQFQKEMWARFSIPLVRLDSVGIQKVRNKIPSNANPLDYYDKVIISIDTLKQEAEYRNFLENSYWDVIVIDEAHNVAERSGHSKRAKLAKLVADKSDSLIMLSATPHDGRRGSFASLMNMLDPTAIAHPDSYTKDDIKGLYIRRFKKDIKVQLAKDFPERIVKKFDAKSTDEEEQAFECLAEVKAFYKGKRENCKSRKSINSLLEVTIEKALFSSPKACLETLQKRINILGKETIKSADTDKEIDLLQSLYDSVTKIDSSKNSKYQQLLAMLKPNTGIIGWDISKNDDRIVIFTERIDTMNFLAENLREDLNLSADTIKTLYGGMPDTQIQEIVEEFGNGAKKIRMLVCSDVASEGINLHYFSHRMIHYDIPWSLMVFQQRNGRVDRYGQQKQPEIYYLRTVPNNVETIKGDTRILDVLIQKDKEVQDSIGDPSEFTHCYDQESEEDLVANIIAEGQSAENFLELLENPDTDDPLADLFGDSDDAPKGEALNNVVSMPTIYSSDYAYVKEALGFINQTLQEEGSNNRKTIQYECNDDTEFITITPDSDIKYRLKFLPPEVLPETGQIHLTPNKDKVTSELIKCRESENSWPTLQLLWEQHPIVGYINDKVICSFKRQQAPVIKLGDDLSDNKCVFIVSSVIPNRKSQPIIYSWYGLIYENGKFKGIIPIDEVIKKFKLDYEKRPNSKTVIDESFYIGLLDNVINHTKEQIRAERIAWKEKNDKKMNEHLNNLKKLKDAHFRQLEFDFQGKTSNLEIEKRTIKQLYLENLFESYQKWIKDAMSPEDMPYIRIVAVLQGGY